VDAVGYRASYKLSEMRRALLLKLNRGGDALDSAWAEFEADPDKLAYQELMRYVPKSQRTVWHEKAMAVSEQGDLDSLIELWLSAKRPSVLPNGSTAPATSSWRA